MRERDRQSIRQFLDEEAKLYAAEKEAKEKPIREAEKQLKQVHRELYAVQKQQIENGKDEALFVDPATIGITMPQDEADKHNAAECKKFTATHGEYLNNDSNNKILIDYLMIRNGVQILSVLTLEKAVERLNEFRLLEEKPAPVEPVFEPLVTFDTPEMTETQNYEIGIDPLTSLERKYTIREVNLMSSDEYRRAFSVTKKSLELPIRNW